MKVTKIYDLTKVIEDTSNDKVIIEMNTEEACKLSRVLYLSKLYTDVTPLAEEIESILKQIELNTRIEHIE